MKSRAKQQVSVTQLSSKPKRLTTVSSYLGLEYSLCWGTMAHVNRLLCWALLAGALIWPCLCLGQGNSVTASARSIHDFAIVIDTHEDTPQRFLTKIMISARPIHKIRTLLPSIKRVQGT